MYIYWRYMLKYFYSWDVQSKKFRSHSSRQLKISEHGKFLCLIIIGFLSPALLSNCIFLWSVCLPVPV